MPATALLQDERSMKLYGDDPVVVNEAKKEEILSFYKGAYKESDEWFRRNYEQDFIRYLANYLSIPGEVDRPWPNANEYFMPSTNITIENYLARDMATIRGGKDFLTVFPRGRDDKDKAKIVQLVLRYLFDQPMRGYQKMVNVKRNKYIYGTSIAMMPWNLEIHKRRIPGVFIWDVSKGDWIREILEEGNIDAETGKPPPKDFSGVDVRALLASNKSFVIRDLFLDVKVKDHPDLEVLDIFNVKIDPNGGPDIQKHDYVIVESLESIDTIKRKADQGIYDEREVDRLLSHLQTKRSREDDVHGGRDVQNDSERHRDAVEGKDRESAVRRKVKLWICYGSHELEDGGFEEETVGIIAEQEFLLRFRPTTHQVNGVPYRPLLVDRFIELPHRFYGVGIGQILESLNYLLNHLVNQILNHGDLFNSPPLIVPSDGQWTPEHNIFGPGQTWYSDNSDGFKILETPDIKASQVQMITFIEGFIQKSLGINDFTLGSAGGIVNNQTAHGLANVLRETNRRIDFYATNSQETFIRDMYQMMLWEAQQFMDEAEIPKITDINRDGPEFDVETIFNDDIQGLYDIKVFADTLTASKEFEQMKSQNFVQILSQLVDPATQMPLYDIRSLGDKFIEAYGEPFPENFHFNPETDPAAQLLGAGPQPETPENPPTPKTEVPKEGRLGPLNP